MAELLDESPFEGLDESDFPNSAWSFSAADIDEIFSDPFSLSHPNDLQITGITVFILI